MEKEKKKKIILLIVGISLLLVATLGASFAYFTAQVNSKNKDTTSIRSATLVNVNMEYGGVINSNGIYPGHKFVKTIRVTGIGEETSIPTPITITLTPFVNDFEQHVRYSIYAVENSTLEIDSICGEAQEETTSGKYYDSMECDTSNLGNKLKTGIFVDEQVEQLDTVVECNTDRTYYIIVEYINDTERDQNNEQGKIFTINLGYAGEEEKIMKPKPISTILPSEQYKGILELTLGKELLKNVTNIIIEPSLSLKANAQEVYDISEVQDKSVMAYVVPNESDESTYTLYLQGENGILANANSSYLFANFERVKTIEGLEYLDTSNVTNMSNMFYNLKNLIQLDVSSFDTSKVTNITYMFGYCESLTSLDLSSFNTSNVTEMIATFDSCNKLKELNISSFDTSNVTDMSSMFSDCSNLTTLDLSQFNTDKVKTMQNMFNSCRSLSDLNLSGSFNNKSLNSFGASGMFSWGNSSANVRIKVSNYGMQQMILHATSCPSSWTPDNVIISS